MAELTEVVGGRVRTRRRQLGLTQAQLAEAADVSTGLVSRIERGVCLPSVPTLVAFAATLKTTPDWLLAFEPPGRRPKEFEALVDAVRRLPAVRRREIRRIAEALAIYERRDD